MTEQKNIDIGKKLVELQQSFQEQLPGKITEIYNLWHSYVDEKSTDNESSLINLHRLTHSLAGSGGTYGAVTISSVARELERVITNIIEDFKKGIELVDNKKLITNELISHLSQVADSWKPTNVPFIKPSQYAAQRTADLENNNLVYLAEDDELLAEKLVISIRQAGYQIKHFLNLVDFEKACNKKLPEIIIMDIIFEDGNIAGTDFIKKLKEVKDNFPPVIFISVRDDIEARIAASSSGAHRYFCKPLNIQKLISSLDSLTNLAGDNPYKILIVDDDEDLLKYYETLLTSSGMNVKTISNSFNCLSELSKFKPDLLVLDVYMPEFSGPELAKVIRLDDQWALMPIMYLSTETNIERQLDAMSYGGDDFLVKPVGAVNLISAVRVRARRSRLTNGLNRDLKNALRESKFYVAAMNEHDIVSSTDVSGNIINVNNKFCEISGYSREQLIGQNHRILKSGIHSSEFYDELWNTISNGNVWHGTICNRNKDGGEYWVKSTIVPFLDLNGKPYKYVSARTDITPLRKSEERLNRSQLFANIGTWDWDIITGDFYWSDRIWNLLGYEKEKVKNSYDNFLAAVHPEDRQLVIESVGNCVEEGIVYNIEHRVIWPDGSIHWLQENGDIVRAEDGSALHMLGVVHDISERIKIEEDLLIAKEDAETANHAKSQFLSSMSHELRTPMNAIMGFAQLLTMDTENTLNSSQYENVDEILKAAKHLLALINEVLDLAKIESGQISLSIETVMLGDVIEESLQLISPLAEKRNIDISVMVNNKKITFDEIINEKYAVFADHIRLKQVLINILSNAVKYNSENGSIQISCENSENTIKINIKDSGEGLTNEQKMNLFKPFERLGAEQTEIEGAGIGLVITKNILEQMNGAIGVESKVGYGSDFWIELPRDKSSENNRSTLETGNNIDLIKGQERKYTVLYIEDNPANLRLVSILLSRLPNIHMWSAHEPMLGLELAEEHVPDIILLDINLPGIDGYEVLKRLRQNVKTTKIPVIAISANAMKNNIEKGMAAGFDIYITKPIDVSKLLESVDMILSKVKNKVN